MSKAEDPVVTCPLDEAHRINKSRMQFHLVKCLKNHNLGSSSQLKCPFNSLHIIEAVEIMHHCQSCPDSESVVLERYETEGEKCYSGIIPIEAHQHRYKEVAPQNNDWDEQCTSNKTAYDPTADIENRPVLRSLNCESKSKRKQFRLLERQRFAALENNGIFNPDPTPAPPAEVPNKPLRQPYSLPQNGMAAAAKPEPAKSVTAQKTSVGIEKTIPELAKDKTKKNQSCDKNNAKDTADDSEEILKILDDVDVASMTDVLNQLQVLDKVESAVKERRSKLINLISASKATKTSGNPISYRDAAKSKSTVVSSGMVGRELPSTRGKPKCAANFNTAGGSSGAYGPSTSAQT